MKSFKEYLSEDKKVTCANWVHPDDANIEHEYNVEVKLHQPHLLKKYPTVEHFKKAVKEATPTVITYQNDDFGGRSHTRNFDELHDLISGYGSYPKFRNKKTLTALSKSIKGGKDPVPMPILTKNAILGGNTRADLSMQHHGHYKGIVLK